MGLLPDPVVRDFGGVQRNFDAIAKLITVGTGDPNNVVTASPPALYLDADGGAGATLWVKETGINTDTGWVAK